MPKNWNRRFKHNRDKMKTGDIFELAEVVRNLSLRDHEKGLSTGEKQMFVKAKKILASELMYAKDMDEEEAALWLEDVLSGVGVKKTKKKAKVARHGAARTVSVWAVLVAAGRGERLGTEHPKAFAKLGGRPLLAESLSGSTRATGSRRSSSSLRAGWEEPAILLAEELGCSKVSSCVAGGATRGDSVRAGVREVPDGAVVILVHDAARPLLPEEVVERLLAPLAEHWDGAVPGLPVADTVKRVRGDEVAETLDRDELVAVQTPRPSRRTCCGARSAATSPARATAPRWSRPQAAA